jgi:antitoxin component YwqK of YwqJK toxin-antitoxin module
MAEQPHNQTDSQGRKQGYWEETDGWAPTEFGYTEKGHYVDGLRQGLWKNYYKDGTLMGEEHYLNGELHGLWKVYYDNGTLGSEGHYLNGKPHGLWKSYHSNGTLQWEGHYLNGEQHGLWKRYHEDGTLESCTLYNMDEELFSSPLLILPSWLNLI